jgi:hypothetical protein
VCRDAPAAATVLRQKQLRVSQQSFNHVIGRSARRSEFRRAAGVNREHPELRPKGDDGPYEVDKSIYEVAGQIRKLAGVE